VSLDDKIKRLEQIDKSLIWHPFTQMKDWTRPDFHPLIITEARDAFIKDIRGRWYMDGVSSIWVSIWGHKRKEIDEAITSQLSRVAHSTLLGLANEASIELANSLAQLMEKSFPGSSLDRVFYSDNGSTAVEAALKMAFQYWRHKGVETKTTFLALENAYHGDTLGAVSVGGIGIFHEAFRHLLFKTYKAPSPYCYRCPMGKEIEKSGASCALACIGRLEEILKEHHGEIAALIIEPMVQAAGGMIVFPEGYLKKARELCSKYNVLFIADEVATGFGKTGRMFACEHEAVCPDIVCLSKGITGGYLPLAATIATKEIYDAFLGEYAELKTFFHGHSYTGNPLACAAALASTRLFETEGFPYFLVPKVSLLRERFSEMESLPNVGEARCLGLIGGIELVRDKKTKEPYPWQERMGWKVAEKALEKGLFVRPLGNVVVVMPPLSINAENLGRMLEIIEESIKEIS
jgi:adenosylmethionine-8-amino-7-oxononanoate aminotransferase